MAEANGADDDDTSIERGKGIEATPEKLDEASDLPAGETVATDATAVVRFRIGGLLRFLSHAETLRLLERACTRAGVPIKYTQGFNPHPKLSLPLPRTVGVASHDELMTVKVFEAGGIPLDDGGDGAESAWPAKIKNALTGVLPSDIVVDAVNVVKSNARVQPRSAHYAFRLRLDERAAAIEKIENRIAEIQALESLVMERRKPNQREGRRIDVKPFVESIRVEDGRVVVQCHVSNAGTIRVDEIMTLLELAPEDLNGPIERTAVTWDIT